MTELSLHVLLWILLATALIVSVVTDLLTRRILDVVTYPAMALALVLRALLGGLGDFEQGFLSGLLAASGAAGLFAMLAGFGKGFGWGDVKLMGAVGACLGYPLILAALVFISLSGALQAAVTLLWHGAFWQTVSGALRRWAARARLAKEVGEELPRRHIPYGVAIALGSFWAMWWDRFRP